jgi:hypothetical protein
MRRKKKVQPEPTQAQVVRRYIEDGASTGYQPSTLGDALWSAKDRAINCNHSPSKRVVALATGIETCICGEVIR